MRTNKKYVFRFNKRVIGVTAALIAAAGLLVAYSYWPKNISGRIDGVVALHEAPPFVRAATSQRIANAIYGAVDYVPVAMPYTGLFALNEDAKTAALIKKMKSLQGKHGLSYREVPVQNAFVISGLLPVKVTKRGTMPHTRWLNVRTGRYEERFPPYGQVKELRFFPQESSADKIYAYVQDFSANTLTAIKYDIEKGEWKKDESGEIIAAFLKAEMQNCYIAGGNFYGGERISTAPKAPFGYRFFERALDGSREKCWEFMAFEEGGKVWFSCRESGTHETAAIAGAVKAGEEMRSGVIPPSANPASVGRVYLLRPPSEKAPMLLNGSVYIPRAQSGAGNRQIAILEFDPERKRLAEFDLWNSLDWEQSDKPSEMRFGAIHNAAGGGFQFDPKRGNLYAMVLALDVKSERRKGFFLVMLSPGGKARILERFSQWWYHEDAPRLLPDGTLYYIRRKAGVAAQTKGMWQAYVCELVKYSPDTDSKEVVFEALDLYKFYPSVG